MGIVRAAKSLHIANLFKFYFYLYAFLFIYFIVENPENIISNKRSFLSYAIFKPTQKYFEQVFLCKKYTETHISV